MVRLAVLTTTIFFLKFAFSLQLDLPRLLKRPGNEAVLGFYRLILALSALDFVAGTLETLAPKHISLLAITLNLFADSHTHLERSRLERFQREFGHHFIQPRAAQSRADRLSPRSGSVIANVASVPLARCGLSVLDLHPIATFSECYEARQQ
jgi:hypothetical protein